MRTLYTILIFLLLLSVQAQKTTITQLKVDKLINPLVWTAEIQISRGELNLMNMI